jgi:SAM-dependent methyltransferase
VDGWPHWAQGDDIDLTRPSIARVYDYWLGGAHNFAIDRAMGEKVLEGMPVMRWIVTQNRRFLNRAVRFMLSRGITQFLDLGSGIPTAGNVHEVAQASVPDARIVYVDVDAVAVAHSRAILTGNECVDVLQADIRDVPAVLESREVQGLLDPSKPVGLLMVALLHFMPDSDDPHGIVAAYADALAPGSLLALSHAGRVPDWNPSWNGAQSTYDRGVTAINFRTESEVEAMFDQFDLVEPGLVRIPMWQPDSVDDLDDDSPRFPGFAAVGRKR